MPECTDGRGVSNGYCIGGPDDRGWIGKSTLTGCAWETVKRSWLLDFNEKPIWVQTGSQWRQSIGFEQKEYTTAVKWGRQLLYDNIGVCECMKQKCYIKASKMYKNTACINFIEKNQRKQRNRCTYSLTLYTVNITGPYNIIANIT